MTELIKRLRVTGNGLSAEWLEYDVPEATNRAEELEAKLTECEARLSKAVEALRWYDDGFTARKARDVLAELEGE